MEFILMFVSLALWLVTMIAGFCGVKSVLDLIGRRKYYVR